MELQEILKLLEQNIKENNIDEIGKISEQVMEHICEIKDIPELLRIAYLYEEIQSIKELKIIYSSILKIDNNNIKALYRLGVISVDTGNDSLAEKIFKRILKIEPEHSSAKSELRDIYLRRNDAGLANCIKTNESEKAYYTTEKDEQTVENYGSISNAHIEKFIELFKSRNDVYASQWIDDNFNIGYNPVHKNMNAAEVISHLKGGSTLGMYCMNIDNCCKWAAIDFDIPKRVLENINSNEEKEKMIAQIFEVVKKINECSVRFGIHPVIENSGNKGAHIWYFFNKPIKASIIRSALGKIIKKMEATELKNVSIELFPKQDELTEKKLGNLVKLPLGIHKKTLKRSFFTDISGAPYKNQLEYLLKIKQEITEENLMEIIELENKKKVDENEINEITKTDDEQEIKKIEESDPFENKELKELKSKCAVINMLIEKICNRDILTYPEKLCLIYTIAFLTDGKKIVDGIMRKCVDYDNSQITSLIQAVGGNPISCNKIKTRVNPALAGISCRCNFELDNRSYPTPILHLNKNIFGEKKMPIKNYINSKSNYSENMNNNNETTNFNSVSNNSTDILVLFERYIYHKKFIDEIIGEIKKCMMEQNRDSVEIGNSVISFERGADRIIIRQDNGGDLPWR